ncbi:MAG: 3-oxoacyl-[acyl-carrier-protein] synthase III C-terminal domain-containing protein, partial [Limisphaerales bacterium]
ARLAQEGPFLFPVAHDSLRGGVTCPEINELFNKRSSTDYQGELETDCKLIQKLIERTGLKTRRWANDGETAFGHLQHAVSAALLEAGVASSKIDLLIYVGVSKGFVEPANAYVVAKDLGLHAAECFDITDACMSWTRALSLIDSLFQTGKYENAMVLNAEFNLTNNNYANYRLTSRADFEYSLPTFTIGEAATATILTKSAEPFRFKFLSKPELADKCLIPTAAYKSFSGASAAGNKRGVDCFTSYGKLLHDHLSVELPKVINHLDLTAVDVVFTHASSRTDWQKYCDDAGIGSKVYHIYQDTGNLVSASIPTAMHSAIRDGRLHRGDRVLLWVGSAGMSFASVSFVY